MDRRRRGAHRSRCRTKRREGRVDIAFGAGAQDIELQPERVRAACTSLASAPAAFGLFGLTEHADRRDFGHELVQQFQPLRPQVHGQESCPGDVAARPVEAGDQPGLDRDRRRSRRRSESSRSRPWPRVPRESGSRTARPLAGRTRSAASAGSRSYRPSSPSDIRSRRSGPRQNRFRSGPAGIGSRELRIDVGWTQLLRNPITGIAGCCARAASGHAAAAPPSSVMNSRRFIRSPRRRGRAASAAR